MSLPSLLHKNPNQNQNKSSSHMKDSKMPSGHVRFRPLAKIGFVTIALTFAAIPPLVAQPVTITSDTTIVTTSTLAAGQSLAYNVDNGATLNFSSGTNLAVFTTGTNSTLTIGPSTPDGDGRTVFSDYTHTGANRQGGILSLVATSTTTLTNVVFRNSTGLVRGGAISALGTLTVTNAEFTGNSANAGGAIDVQSVTASLYNVLFDGNIAGSSQGGAIAVQGGAVAIWDAVFVNNRSTPVTGNGSANNLGGAVFVNQTAGRFALTLTGGNGVTDYKYTGNYATGASNAALAGAGGFLYVNSNVGNSNVTFDIGEGVTLTLGEAAAGTNRNHDTIASTSTNVRIMKLGNGDMILNADNSNIISSSTISAGRLLLGNDEAVFSGTNIGVLANATLGGLGTYTAPVNAAGQSIIQVGLDNAPQAQTLVINGALTLDDAAQIQFDLYNDNQADLLVTSTLVWTAGSNHYINLSALATGSFELAKADTMNVTGGLTLWINGAVADAARYAGALTTTATGINLTGALFSLSGTWAGANGAEWRNSGTGWDTGTTDVSFQNGDNVTFATSGSVNVAPSGVTASRMNVGGPDTLTIAGDGSITTDGESAQPGSTAPAPTDGRLVKNDAGMLVFANTGVNRFTGGVIVNGGAISIDNTAQLDATGTTIRFENTGTLVARAGIGGVLASGIELANDATVATLEVSNAADNLAMSGALRGASGIFAKSGPGTLTLTGDSGAFSGTTQIDTGALMLAPGANLGGSTILTPAGMLGGAGTVNKLTTTPGSIIQPGMTGAAMPGTLAFNTLELAADTTIRLTLVSGDDDPAASVNSRITAGTLAFAGAGVTGSSITYNLNAFIVGSYDIASFTNYNAAALADFAGAGILLSGRALTGREFASISVAGGAVSLSLDKASEIVAWTGEENAVWTSGANWSGGGNAGIEFADGDTVLFNSAGAGANRNIAIEGAEVVASGMEVSGNGSYRFSGGMIVLDASSAGGVIKGHATGTLVMNSSGTLTLANDGVNDFRQGVLLQNGTLELASAGALGTSRVNATGSNVTMLVSVADMDLQNTTAIANGATLNLDTQAGDTILSGTITGAGNGALVKKGGGTLSLAPAGMIDVDTFSMDAGALNVSPHPAAAANLRVRTIFNLGPNATLLAASGTSMIAAADFNHHGMIKIGKAAGETGWGVLNISGNYNAQPDSQLFLNIGVGSFKVVSDQLVVGGVFSGTLNVRVLQTDSMATNYNWDWQPIVCGSIAADAEIISNPVYLGGTATDKILIIDRQAGTITWQNIPPPELPAVAALDLSAMLASRLSNDTISRQLAVLRDSRVPRSFDTWAAGMYRDDTVKPGIYGGAAGKTQGLQAGAGATRGDAKKAYSAGLFADCVTTDMDQPGNIASTRTESKGVGAYATFAAGCWYLDASARGSRENHRVSAPNRPSFNTDGATIAYSVGTGLTFGEKHRNADTDFCWEPQLQLSYQRHTIDDATDHAGRVYQVARFTSLQGRAGVRFWRDFSPAKNSRATVWLRASYLQSFLGDSTTRVADDVFANNLNGRGWMADGGVRTRIGGHVILDLSAACLGDNPTRGLSLNASLTLAW
jgi:outer membrane autotransporter protein